MAVSVARACPNSEARVILASPPGYSSPGLGGPPHSGACPEDRPLGEGRECAFCMGSCQEEGRGGSEGYTQQGRSEELKETVRRRDRRDLS